MDRCEPDAKEVKINQVYCKTAAPGAKKKLNHDVQAQAGIALMVLLLWNVFSYCRMCSCTRECVLLL